MAFAPISSRPPADLDRIIRPYVRVAPKPDRSRVFFGGDNGSSGEAQDTEGQDVPVLAWEAMASVNTVTLPGVGFSVFESDFTETKRITHPKRIVNPDDSSQFVDVEVIDNISYENGAGVPSTYALHNDEETP